MIVSGNFGALLTPIYRKIWGDNFNAIETQYDKVLQVSKENNRSEVKDHSITTLGLPVEKAEGSSISYGNIYDGFTKTYTFTVYGLGVITTKEMVSDDLYGNIKKIPAQLGVSMREFREICGANIFNRAFNSSYLGGDGVCLGSASHPSYAGAGNYSNMPNSSADFDITSYEAALIDIRTNFTDDAGKKMRVKPQKLIIHPNDWFQAEKVLKSAQEPDTAYNAINPAKGTMPQGYITLDYLTDTDAWFIKTDQPDGPQWIDRWMPELTQDNDFDTDNARHKGTMRFGTGWTNPRSMYCVAGV